MSATDAGWLVLALTACLALALAVVAFRVGRTWFSAPAVLPVIGALAMGASLPAAPPPGIGVPLWIALGLLAVVAGSPLVSLVLHLASPRTVPLKVQNSVFVTRGGEQQEELRGGVTIGLLERLAFVGCVLLGQPGGIAVIVAVKGLGRFNELNTEQTRERFIVGTLASLTWVGACTAAIVLSAS
jgi:hypothetical protein